MAKKETISPPTKKVLHAASKDLRKGGSEGGRILREQGAAIRQGAAKGAAKK
ncbi:hypothetical protein ACQ5TV_05400 [Acetobacter ghanensis]|uniref:hypothetical protein n=1 Tax=Acetobacter ghanensis TaxID=431306 RepID=UPI003D3482EE